MSSSRLYVQLGYLLHLSSTTHKNAAAAGFANGPRTYYNYMIWGIPMGKYAQQQCHGMELKSHKKKVLSHLYPIFKPTMFVDFGVVDMFGWIQSYFGVTRSIQLKDSNVQLEITFQSGRVWSHMSVWWPKMAGRDVTSNRCSHTRLNHGLKQNNFLRQVDAIICGEPNGKI